MSVREAMAWVALVVLLVIVVVLLSVFLEESDIEEVIEMSLVNAYTIYPDEIEVGNEMLYIVKAMVSRGDKKGLRYRLYRCLWEGDEDDIPQGSRIYDTMGQFVGRCFQRWHQLQKKISKREE